MTMIAETLRALRVGEPVIFERLTMWPLVGEDTAPADYVTLDEALAQALMTVTEVSEQGRVPELAVINAATRPVLLVDGEELVGAKQNRVVNLSILVPAATKTMIPVSCVEAGRWSRRTHTFASAERLHYASGRARRIDQVSASLRAGGGRRSNQGAVWADIAEKAERLSTPSPTGAMSAMYEAHEARLQACARAFVPLERQRGAIFAVDGGVMGLDLFDCAGTFARLLPKLVRSYALDALDAEHAGGARVARPGPPRRVLDFLQAIATAPAEPYAAVGEGRDLRLRTERLSGAALVAHERVVHVSAFGAAADFA